MIYLQVIVAALIFVAILLALFGWREKWHSLPDDPLWMWWIGLGALCGVVALFIVLGVGAHTLVTA